MKHGVWEKIKCFPDVIAGIILFLACIVFYTQLGEIRRLSALSDSVGPRFFPRLILIVLMVLAALIIAGGIPKGRKNLQALNKEKSGCAPAKETPETAVSALRWLAEIVETNGTVRTWISILGIFFFILLMKPLGFAISGAIYLFLQFSLLAPAEKRKLWLYAVIAVVVSFGSYLIFRYAIHLNLPAGPLANIL